MTKKIIKRLFCHDLKLEPFRIKTELKLVVILIGVIIESKNDKQTKQVHIR